MTIFNKPALATVPGPDSSHGPAIIDEKSSFLRKVLDR